MAEQIVIEILVDDSQLQPTIDLLEKTGQIDSKLAGAFRQTTAEINKQASALRADAAATTPLKKNLEDINKATKSVTQSFMQGFQEGVIDTLKEAGVSVEQFTDALTTGQTEVSNASESLRTRLKNLTAQIADMKLKGEDGTDQFKQLVVEAGRVKDAMADAGQEIKNVASDTGTFDGLISAAQGVAGGFAIAQGGLALFGDESEELQKTLLKVNSVMAILQGLQQVQTVLLKESAASRLADVVATKAQVVIQRIYTLVTGQSTAATKAFKIALASTGIGLLIVGIAAAVQALQEYALGADEAAEAQERLNETIGNANKALAESNQIYLDAISDQKVALEEQLALAEARGDSELSLLALRKQIAAEESTIGKKSLENLGLTRIGVERLKLEYDGIIGQLASINEAGKNQLLSDNTKEAAEAAAELTKKLEARASALKPLLDAGLQAVQQIDGAQQKSALLEEAIRKQQEKDRREALLNRLNDELAALERRLLVTEEGSEQELRLQQAIVNKRAEIELTNEKLTVNQIALIKDQAREDNLKKERDFNKKLTQEAINGQISRNNALLSNINIADEEKLRLSISNIELAAQLEIEAAGKNAEKIKEIIAKREADIIALKKNSIDQQAEAEIDRITTEEGVERRALQRLVADEKQSSRLRIVAIQQLAEKELDTITIRENALIEQRKKGLISEQEYNDQYAKLQDDKAKISEDTEQKITGIHESETEKRKKLDQETIELALNVASQVSDILAQLADQKAERDQQQIEGERAKVQELLEAGAITEKEAIARNKRIDAEEKKLKREAAQRDKALAIFNAVVNTAAAVTKALPNLVLAGIAAALGAAQIAIIASRPIPKFKGGKKNRYEGPGIIGEDGSEIFEHDGKRYIAHKETLVWLGKSDKVYTPQETKRMLPSVDRELMKSRQGETIVMNDIDYDELGKAVGKHVKVPGITIDEHGFKAWQQEGLSRRIYHDKYYSSR